MERKYLYVLIPGVLIIAATAWLTYPPSKPKSVGDPSKYRFMHCPECRREFTYAPSAFEKPCLYCDKSLVGTETSIKEGGGAPNPFNRMFLFVFTELVGIMAAVWYVGRPRPEDPEEDYLYFNCGQCRQKIRFVRDQIGQWAMCRRCKRPFRYPEEDTSDA